MNDTGLRPRIRPKLPFVGIIFPYESAKYMYISLPCVQIIVLSCGFRTDAKRSDFKRTRGRQTVVQKKRTRWNKVGKRNKWQQSAFTHYTSICGDLYGIYRQSHKISVTILQRQLLKSYPNEDSTPLQNIECMKSNLLYHIEFRIIPCLLCKQNCFWFDGLSEFKKV